VAGLKRRFGPERSLRSKSINPRAGIRGNIPNPIALPKALGNPLKLPSSGITVVPRVKFVTFDRNIIRSNWSKINRNPMQRAGNLIRMIARGSIKRVGRRARPSAPGHPPKSRWGSGTTKGSKRSRTPPFKMIFNKPISLGTGQIIGMVGFNTLNIGEPPVPGLHEHGGHAFRKIINPKYPQVPPRNAKGQFTRINVPHRVRRYVSYPKRPFMHPALMKARHRIPSLWRNSFNRVTRFGRAA